MSRYDINELYEGILAGDRSLLSRAITLIESQKPEHQEISGELISRCLTNNTNSRRIGISGSPGVGKSTFIERIGLQMVETSGSLAVLAIDPSSPLTRGSILGDKTRMEELARNPNVYIRPSPAGTTLGGVARKSRETIVLCEAAGFKNIIVETVGVGQSEITVRHLVDCFILLLLPGAGDDLQGIKKGIVEMADLIVINKADGEQLTTAQKTVGFYASALHMLRGREDQWNVQVKHCSALNGTGIDEILNTISKFFDEQSSAILERRALQNQYWYESTVNEKLLSHFLNTSNLKTKYNQLKSDVASGKISAFEAADQILQYYLEKR